MYLGLSFGLNFLDCHFLKHFPFDGAIEAVLLKGETPHLFGSVADVEFFEHGPRFLLVEMVNDEEVGDVLALRHCQPAAASGVPVEVGAEVVELVVDDPILGSVAPPQFRVPRPLLIEPCLRIALNSSGWERFPVWLYLVDMHDVTLIINY